MLTPTGWGTLVAALVLFAAAAALGYPALAVLAAGCALAALAGVAWTLPEAPVAVRREIAPRRVTRGQPAVGVLTLVNGGRRRARPGAVERCGEGTIELDLPAIPGRGRRVVTCQLPTGRRGELAVGPLTLVRSDPLGITRRTHVCGETLTLLVRPAVHPLPMPAMGRAGHLEGSTSGAGRGSPITFHALREYVPGDDLRLVHWRSSARLGTLVTRELRDADRPHATVVLDVRSAAYGEPAPGPGSPRNRGGGVRISRGGDPAGDGAAFELAVEAAASIAVAAGRRGQPVRVLAGSEPALQTRGAPADIGRVLDRLALVRPQPDDSLLAALAALRGVPTGGLLAVVTGDLSRADAAEVARLGPRFERILVLRTCAAGEPPAGGVAWIDAPSAAALVAGWRRELAG